MSKFLRIIEVMWLVVAAIALTTAIVRAVNGQAWGNYLYITVFTGCVAGFMYWFKKRSRRYMEAYYAEKDRPGKAA
jgi:uncharacterized membrane-anchored protein